MKKIIIIILSICFLMCLLLEMYSHSEKIKYEMVESIEYHQYLGNPITRIYTEKKDIQKMSQRIKRLNFYPSKFTSLQESPTAIISLTFKNGDQKKIYIAGAMARIDSRIYWINPINIKKIFK